MEDGLTVERRLTGGLDEQMRPRRVVGIPGQPGAVGDPGRGEREVALRARRHGPEAVVPGGKLEGRDPVGLRPGQVGLGVLAVAERQQPGAELPLVERPPSLSGDGSQRPGHPRSLDDGARSETAVAGVVARLGKVGHRRRHGGQGRRGGKAPLGVRPGGLEHGGEVQAAEPFVQRKPAVDAARHGNGADVAERRHPLVTLGPQT